MADIPPPGSAPSPEAQAFIDAPPMELPPLDARAAPEWRALVGAAFLPRAERAAARHGVATDIAVFGGTECLVVTPPGWDGRRQGIYCYGGGYFTGSPEQDLIVAAPLAAKTGIRLIAPRYRLAPEHPHPAAVEDGWAVWRALDDLAVLVGESAGGNLALCLLHRALSAPVAMPGAIALLSPWCDLTGAGAPAHNAEGHDPTLDPEVGRLAAAFYAGGRDPAHPDISPLLADWPGGLPPVLMTTASRDLLRDQVLRLDAKLRAVGNDVRTDVWPGLWHVFEFYDEIPEAARSLDRIAGFLSDAEG